MIEPGIVLLVGAGLILWWHVSRWLVRIALFIFVSLGGQAVIKKKLGGNDDD